MSQQSPRSNPNVIANQSIYQQNNSPNKNNNNNSGPSNAGSLDTVLMTQSNAMMQGLDNDHKDGEGGTGVLPNVIDDLLKKGEEEDKGEEEEEEEAKDSDEQQKQEEEEKKEVREPPKYYEYHNEYNNTMRSTLNSTRRSPRPQTSRSTRSRGVMAKATDPQGLADEFEKGATMSNAASSTLAQTVVELENRRNEKLQSGKMRESTQLQMALDNAKTAQKESCKRETQQQALQQIHEKREAVENEYRAMQKEYKQKEQELNQKLNEYVESVETKQKNEMQELDKKWQSDNLQRRYNRTSQQLRILRMQQNKLVGQKRYNDSDHVNQIANRLEREEAQDSYNKMLNDYIVSRKILENKQKEEMETAITTTNRRRDEFRYFFETKKKPYIARLQNLQKDEDEVLSNPDGVWNLKHRNDGDVMVQAIGTRSIKMTTRPQTVADYNTLKLPPLPMAKSSRIDQRQNDSSLNKTGTSLSNANSNVENGKEKENEEDNINENEEEEEKTDNNNEEEENATESENGKENGGIEVNQ